VVSTKAYQRGEGDGVFFRFRFLASQCRDCSRWNQCRGPDASLKGHRNVYISDDHSYLWAGATFNQTAVGRALLAGRWWVEPTIAFLVRYQGCRRARRVGQAAGRCQLYRACAMRNLLLWLSRARRGRTPRLPT